MKALTGLMSLFLCLPLGGAELDASSSCSIVVQRCGVLNHAMKVKEGDKIHGVFVTFYLNGGNFGPEAKTVETLIAKAKGGYHDPDPLPHQQLFAFVIMNPKKQGLNFAVSKDGIFVYRGAREFAEGVYEDDDSVFKSGSFKDDELAAQLTRLWQASKKSDGKAAPDTKENGDK